MIGKKIASAVAVVTVLGAVLSFGGAGTAVAAPRGAVQLSSLGVPNDGSCDIVAYQADLALLIERDESGWSLEGCLYVFIETSELRPSGTYKETGTEVFVGDLYDDNAFVGSGTFDTTYRFTAKFEDDGSEIFGRCQHPIVDGSGTGVFEGASGRLDFKDVISESGVEFPMRGNMRLPGAD